MCSIKILLRCWHCNNPQWISFEPNLELSPLAIGGSKPWECTVLGCKRPNEVQYQKIKLPPTHPIPVSEVCKPEVKDSKQPDASFPAKNRLAQNIKRKLQIVVHSAMCYDPGVSTNYRQDLLFEQLKDWHKLTGQLSFHYKGVISLEQKMIPEYSVQNTEINDVE